MYDFDIQAIYPFFDRLPAAIWTTVEISFLATIFSAVMGVFIALMRRSDQVVLRGIGMVYVEIIRNMPLLVLLYLVFFGLPAVGIVFDGFMSGLIALTLNSAAFMAEIFRAGLIAVPKGQYEAARSQGMTRVRMYRFVILPQILRVSYAPLGNQVIGVIMGSSIMMIATVEELTAWMNNTGSVTYRYFEAFVVVAIAYLVLCQAANVARMALGRFLFKSVAAGGRW
ncbi:MAG: amino acid ABC transporter permease [Hyphomicrobiales bacterium]|nr:amino acid ABC transporter permease [Hyphomicrobiales bacterium]